MKGYHKNLWFFFRNNIRARKKVYHKGFSFSKMFSVKNERGVNECVSHLCIRGHLAVEK